MLLCMERLYIMKSYAQSAKAHIMHPRKKGVASSSVVAGKFAARSGGHGFVASFDRPVLECSGVKEIWIGSRK